MATPSFQSQPRPYSSRCKIDSYGREHWQIYLPSKRGYAWTEVIDLPNDRELRDQILDPDFLPAWKLWWLEEAYARYRERENARKRKDTSYSDWRVEPWDECQAEPWGMSLPEFNALRQREQIEAERVLAVILLPLTPQQRKYLTLSLGEGWSYADIARQEKPDSSQAEINRAADAVRKTVNRAKKRILSVFGGTRPDPNGLEDV